MDDKMINPGPVWSIPHSDQSDFAKLMASVCSASFFLRIHTESNITKSGSTVDYFLIEVYIHAPENMIFFFAVNSSRLFFAREFDFEFLNKTREICIPLGAILIWWFWKMAGLWGISFDAIFQRKMGGKTIHSQSWFGKAIHFPRANEIEVKFFFFRKNHFHKKEKWLLWKFTYFD